MCSESCPMYFALLQVRRLCSTLVSEKPADGQECSVHEDQVCFIQVRVTTEALVAIALNIVMGPAIRP